MRNVVSPVEKVSLMGGNGYCTTVSVDVFHGHIPPRVEMDIIMMGF
jgi:hypothetical protein